MPLSAADRGSAIHGAVGDFTQAFPQALPAERRKAAARDRRAAVCAADGSPRGAGAVVAALPAHRRLVCRLGAVAARRARCASSPRSAVRCRFPWRTVARSRLSARADRIEEREDGFAVLDYKTGAPPTDKQVRIGLAPQLTLTAAILRAGGFDTIAAGSSDLRAHLCPAQRQHAAGRTATARAARQADRSADLARRSRARSAREARAARPPVRGRGPALQLAESLDVAHALRRL